MTATTLLRFAAVVLSIVISPALFAQCVSPGTVLVYGNGVRTKFEDAENDRITLLDAARATVAPRIIADSWTAYNNTAGGGPIGTAADLIEGLAQDLLTSTTQVIRWLGGLDPMPDAVKNRLIAVAQTFDKLAITNADLQDHVTHYHEFLKTNRTILVAHSQGNFFANLAWDQLGARERQSFSIVSVATFDSYVAGYPFPYTDAYTTSGVDVVIAGFRALGYPALAPNVTNGITLRDLSGHSFADSYLRVGSTSRNDILGNIAQAIDRLQDPTCNQLPIATITGLGDLPGGNVFSRAWGVSSDGQTVVGESNGQRNNEAFRWTKSTGMQGLGHLNNAYFDTLANAVSTDGKTVVGRGNRGTELEAFRWTESGGMQGLGYPLYEAFGVSGDGSVVVGYSYVSEAFRWTVGGGVQGLGDLPGGAFFSGARAVSRDGSVVVGVSIATLGSEAFRWNVVSGMQTLGELPGGGHDATAYGVSADGSTVVGWSRGVPNDAQAFRWTSSGGMQSLGLGGVAYGVSADGRMVVGEGNAPGSAAGIEAFLWTEGVGVRRLQEVLETDYGLNLQGWFLAAATGISDDGKTIVGWGFNPGGETEAWVVTLNSSQIVTGSFAATVTFVLGNPPAGIGVGSGLVGQFTYDSAIPDGAPLDPNLGLYDATAIGTPSFTVFGNGGNLRWSSNYVLALVQVVPSGSFGPYAFRVFGDGPIPLELDKLEIHATQLGSLSPLATDALPTTTTQFDFSKIGELAGQVTRYGSTPQDPSFVEYTIFFTVDPASFRLVTPTPVP